MTNKLNVQTLLWLALILALAGSLWQVAAAFALIDNNIFLGSIKALAVDVGIVAIALGITQRRRNKQASAGLWAGLAIFTIISVYANLVYGFNNAANLPESLPGWVVFSLPWVLSAALPLLVIYLAEIVGYHTSGIWQDTPQIVNAEIVQLEDTPRIEMDTPEIPDGYTKKEAIRYLDTNYNLGVSQIAEIVSTNRTYVYKALGTNGKDKRG